VERYVAIGDSTTEGLEDPASDGSGYIGFADRLALRLAQENQGLLYANLGVRGRQMHQIRAEQLEPALALGPDLVTLVGGLNDVLRPRMNLAAVAGHYEAMASALRAGGAIVLGMTFPDPARIMPVARPTRPRVMAFNQALRDIASRHGLLLVDLERHGVVDRRLWSVDRLHANRAGHARIAAAMVSALGLEPDEDPWAPLPEPEPIRRAAVAAGEVAWLGRHFAPWVLRRLRGHSSGDARAPKRPQLAPVRADPMLARR
jgi:lysophospholipase L1-like esterase